MTGRIVSNATSGNGLVSPNRPLIQFPWPLGTLTSQRVKVETIRDGLSVTGETLVAATYPPLMR